MPDTIDRLGQIRHGPGGAVYRIVATCNGTGRCHFAIEGTEPPGGGPPLHQHSREDEWFFVLSGELTLWADGKISTISTGGSAFAARNIPHTFKNRSKQPLQYLVLATPGDIEPFFDFGLPLANGSAPSDQQLIENIMAQAGKFGIEILGPSPL